MDTYPPHDPLLRHYLSYRHGPRSGEVKMARPYTDTRYGDNSRCLFSGPHAQGPTIRSQHPRSLCELPNAHVSGSSRLWSIPEDASRRTQMGQGPAMAEQHAQSIRHCTQLDWQTHASRGLGADDIWWHHGLGLLSGRSPRAMSGTFHNGRCIYWLWNCDDNHPPGGAVLVAENRAKPGILRLVAHCCMGLR